METRRMFSMRLTRYLLHATLAVAACLASYDMAQAAEGDNSCRATGATSNENGGWDLDCEGKCPLGEEGRPDCDESNGSDSKGSYWACSCDENGGLNNTCCVLVLRPVKRNSADGNTKYRLGVKGDCPSCHSSGVCQVVANAPGGPQAACK
jgi:hypothetical protein